MEENEQVEYLNKKQAALRLGVTPRTMTTWLSRRLIPYMKIGRTVRLKLSDVQNHLATKCRIEAR